MDPQVSLATSLRGRFAPATFSGSGLLTLLTDCSLPVIPQLSDLPAADFNADGKVDLKDALEILKYSIGVTTSHAPKWQFYDETETIAHGAKPANDFSQMGKSIGVTADRPVNLVGVLTGDVDGSWATPPGSTYIDSQHFVALLGSLQSVDTDVSLARWGIYG